MYRWICIVLFTLYCGVLLSTGVRASERAVLSKGPIKKELVKKADVVFAAEVAFELKSIVGYQLSVPQDQDFNRQLAQCVWMLKPDETDCTATDSKTLYGFSFFRQSGVLLSDGFDGSQQVSLDEIKEELSNRPSLVGGFSLDRSRCMVDVGLGCDFRVFTSFRARCPEGKDACGRAEALEIYYFVVYRKPGGDERTVVTNLVSRKPIVVRTEQILQLGPQKCSSNLMFSGYRPIEKNKIEIECNPTLAAAQALCREDATGALLASVLGSAACRQAPSRCRDVCTRALSVNNPLDQCQMESLAFNPLAPIVFRCRDNVGFVNPRLIRTERSKPEKCMPGELLIPGSVQVVEGCAFSFLNICFWLSKPNFAECVRENRFLWFSDFVDRKR